LLIFLGAASGCVAGILPGAACGFVAFPILQSMLIWKVRVTGGLSIIEISDRVDFFAGLKGAFRASFICSLAGAVTGTLLCAPLSAILPIGNWIEVAVRPLTGGLCVGAALGFISGFFYGAFCGGMDDRHCINMPKAEAKRVLEEYLNVYWKRLRRIASLSH
jgi:hypothetical protein